MEKHITVVLNITNIGRLKQVKKTGKEEERGVA
jgi:hypothetical protein